MNEAIVALLAAAVATLPGIIANIIQSRRNHGELTLMYQKAAAKAESERQRMQEYTDALISFARELEAGVAILLGQIRRLGDEPEWRPCRTLSSVKPPPREVDDDD